MQDPSRQEVADWINRDNDDFFGKIYSKKKSEFDLSKPDEDDIGNTKLSLPQKVNDSILVKEEIHPRSAEENKELFSKIDVDVRREDGKISQVVFEYPTKLRKFLGSRFDS